MYLTYDMLTLDQQAAFLEIWGQIAPPRSIAQRTFNLTALGAMTALTGGTNLLFALPRRTAAAYIRHRPERVLEEFLRGQIALHDCEGINIDSPVFDRIPVTVAYHLPRQTRSGDATNGQDWIGRVKQDPPSLCPYCKKGFLYIISSNATQKTYSCSIPCSKGLLQIQNSDKAIKLVAAGSSVVLAGVALIKFFEDHRHGQVAASGLADLDPSNLDFGNLDFGSLFSGFDASGATDFFNWISSLGDLFGF